LSVCTSPCFGQQSARFAGDYFGQSGPIHVKLHIIAATDGALSGTIDSPDQNLTGLPLADIHANEQSLSFTVPIVHGSWVGFINNDGSALSGTWNQGNPLSLNFARVGSKDSAVRANPMPSSPVATPTAPAPASGCPANSLANYWDGTSWRPLRQAVQLPRERGVSITGAALNPLNPLAGYTTIYRYKGASADIKLTSNPKFCFPLAPNVAAQAVIGQLDVKGDVRQTEIRNTQKRNTTTPFADKKTFEADLDTSKGSSFEATPKKALPPGQYLIANGFGFYDFSVE